MIKPSNKIVNLLKEENFQTCMIQNSDDYFPEFLEISLKKYIDYYNAELLEHVDLEIPFEGNRKDAVISKITNLSTAISETIKLYYSGQFQAATKVFFDCLDQIFYQDIKILKSIIKGNTFYRARKNENKHFSKSELFHIAFENRHLVSTNRYSLPGFPALYIADSTYTCWEEFDRHRLRDLWFSKFQNQSTLNVIVISHFMDFINSYFSNNDNEDQKLAQVLSYLATFPLSLACTIKVKNSIGNFKAEYIIPQLLLEYVSKNDSIDGIRFPSTKVDYKKIRAVRSYNYVFPVRSNAKNGYCEKLIEKFYISEPTSLELEEIIFNSSNANSQKGNFSGQHGDIELIVGKKVYMMTLYLGKSKVV